MRQYQCRCGNVFPAHLGPSGCPDCKDDGRAAEPVAYMCTREITLADFMDDYPPPDERAALVNEQAYRMIFGHHQGVRIVEPPRPLVLHPVELPRPMRRTTRLRAAILEAYGQD